MIFKRKFIFCTFFIFISCLIAFKLFYPIYISNEIIITYGIHPFDICSKNPKLWEYIKITFIFTYIFSNFIFSNFIFNYFLNNFFIKKFKKKSNIKKSNSDISKLNLLIGKNNNEEIIIPEKGLYQNFLITGTIGSGKTSSAMYPFTKQLLKYNSDNPNDKIGMLILDVKGNYYNQVKNYVDFYNLQNDLIEIGLNSGIFYNPLHKPNLKPIVLANRLKTILTLFSENNSESYWLDKAEQILAESIKLCRLYNDNYVTFSELHKLITIPSYYKEKLKILKDLFVSSKLNNKQIYELNECLNFFQKEFENLDSRTKGILISEITRITNTFISDYDIFSTFSPDKTKLNFLGFQDVIRSGKIVVLNMNISEYSLLSKIIATYLKLDFQTEILSSLSSGIVRKTAFICDEYDKYCTKTDSDFFSLSRESKCINIVSTQSYSSLKNTLKDESSVKVITQNLINKIWFRTDDIFTIEEAQKQLGKEEKQKISKTISESAKETNFNYITNTLNSMNSNISESYNSYYQNEYIYDTNFFTRNLETFTALTFLSTGDEILKPCKIEMLPYFRN
ncbi:MAG: type IV secretion system DNA-binding domain-containing protein [Clostridia bacterium]